MRKLCVLCSYIGLSRHPTIEEVVCSLFSHRLESVGTLLLRKLCVLCSYIGLSQYRHPTIEEVVCSLFSHRLE